MGYQNGNDNGQMQGNVDKNSASTHRTSKTEELCNSTSKAQYKRLTDGGLKVVPTGDQIGRGTI